MEQGQLPASPAQAYRQARIVIGALVAGVVLFYAVTFFLDLDAGGTGMSPSLALTIWAVLAVGTVPVALLFRNRAAALSDDLRRTGRAPGPAELGNVTTNAIVAAAMLEGPALFAGAMAFVTGDMGLLLYGGLVFMIGMALIFPRAEWYGVDPRRA